MNYYILPNTKVVRVEVMEITRQQELQAVHNWFDSEEEAKKKAEQYKQLLKGEKV